MDMHGCVAGVAKLLRMLAGLGRGRGTFELTEEATGVTQGPSATPFAKHGHAKLQALAQTIPAVSEHEAPGPCG